MNATDKNCHGCCSACAWIGQSVRPCKTLGMSWIRQRTQATCLPRAQRTLGRIVHRCRLAPPQVGVDGWLHSVAMAGRATARDGSRRRTLAMDRESVQVPGANPAREQVRLRAERAAPSTSADRSADYHRLDRRLAPTRSSTSADYRRPERRLAPTRSLTRALTLLLTARRDHL